MSIDPLRFREVIGHFASGVAVVTTTGPDGRDAGLTTNAVTSLSLDPLLLIVCFDNRSRTLGVVRDAGRFGVSFLRRGDEAVAATFASKLPQEEKFAATAVRREDGVPVLADAVAWMVCDVHELLPGGDHTIGVGAVVAADADEHADPLLFFRGGWRALA